MKFRLKAASGPLTGETFELGAEASTIGSNASMDVVIDGLAGEHATIRAHEGGLVIEPIKTGAVFVNGEAVDGMAGLTSGDEVRLGELRFVLQAPGLKPQRVLHQTKPKRRPRWGWLLAGLLAGAALALGYLYIQRPDVLGRAMESFKGGEPVTEPAPTEPKPTEPRPTEEPAP